MANSVTGAAISPVGTLQKHLVGMLLVFAAVASDAAMSFLDHLDELRKRLIISVVALVVAFLIAFAFVSQIFAFMMQPLLETLPAGGSLVYTEPAEGFLLNIKMAALAGIFIASPVILWQVWLFVAPGLYAHEKKFAIPFVVLSSVFFVSGGLFSHFIAFRALFTFFGSYSTDAVVFLPRISPTFSMYTKMLLAFGVIFQMPTMAFFLARMGLLTPRWLIQNFKYAVLVIFILAAVFTASPDPVNQIIMAGPMLALYGLSILIAWMFAKSDVAD